MSSDSRIRVLLAYDSDIVCSTLRDRFKADEPDLAIVADARDGESAVRLTSELTPDVVVMNVVLPVLDGIRATRQIVQSSPKVTVIGFSLHDDPRLIEAMLEAGARAYLLVDRDWDTLPDEIRASVASRSL